MTSLVDDRGISRPLKRLRTETEPDVASMGMSSELGSLLTELRSRLNALSTCVPTGSYFKYSNMWSHGMQSACFVVAFAHYLQTEKLVTIEACGEKLGGENVTKSPKLI